MTPSLKRKLTIGAVAGSLACLAGGGAYAATQSSTTKPSGDPQQAFLSDVAGRLHVSVADLQAALKGAAGDQVDNAVKAGKLTQSQADAIKKRLAQAPAVPFFAPFLGIAKRFAVPGPRLAGPLGLAGPLVKPFAGPLGRPLQVPFAPPAIFRAGVNAATKYLGVTAKQLKQQVRSGKSLADIAKAQNKTADGLITAIKDAVKARLDAAVSAKKLTQAQETKLLTFADQAIPRIVNGTRMEFPRRALGFHPRFKPGP